MSLTMKKPAEDVLVVGIDSKAQENENSKSNSEDSKVTTGGVNYFGCTRLIRDLVLLTMKISFSIIFTAVRLLVPPSMKNLVGETVVITGAGRGIGREIAIKLATLGCIVVCWDIDEEANRSTISKIIEEGGEAYGYLVDVSKRLEVRETVRMMRRNKVPEVTILINNAAVLIQRPFLEHSYEDVESTFGVNVLSNFWTIEAFLPTMLQNGSGHVVSMCSMCGMFGVSQKVAYCSSKYAVRGLMDSIREELRLHPAKPKINLTTIYPFYVATGLAKDPQFRFPYIFRAVTAEYAAEEVIKAVRRNYTECTIPRCLFPLNSIIRLFPESAKLKILDFLSKEHRH
ncbi:short-chain dehydrogenase/reductase family 16C member 6-like [Venturia canescens]|uniref:short-chain dehydrogenase/reductase family 16C member 6-like n=1 Tax=Venturia canescens TaxID=32260 RepID=UPI001C9CE455|nr:short-chain dehydrogenase/reductase family 16C member 6-like [Venturia canescens]